jgi:probable O-glycosylation ligase (exosortase A-associated)
MQSLLFFAVVVIFIFFGLKRPIIAFAGYIWVDLVTPQKMTFGITNQIPMSQLIMFFCILSFALNYKRLKVPQNKTVISLFLIFALYITITTFTALFPAEAWIKWDSSIKTMLGAFLMLFIVKDKRDLELLIAIFVISLFYFAFQAGLQGLLGGGGYGGLLFSGGNNNNLTESSTLALICVLSIPMVIFMHYQSILLPILQKYKIIVIGFSLLVVGVVIATSARTGLIALVVLAGLIIWASKKKFKYGIIAIILVSIAISFVPEKFTRRMNTIKTAETESSASTRLVVWAWTWDFVKTKPFGGGFGSYRANYGQLAQYDTNKSATSGIQYARAFHSIYFEVLGEHGYLGFMLYFGIALHCLKSNRHLRKTHKDPWVISCATNLNRALMIYLAGGAFIGVAFQPFFFFLVVFSVSLAKVSHDSLKRKKKNTLKFGHYKNKHL